MVVSWRRSLPAAWDDGGLGTLVVRRIGRSPVRINSCCHARDQHVNHNSSNGNLGEVVGEE